MEEAVWQKFFYHHQTYRHAAFLFLPLLEKFNESPLIG
jgi:hypothetical protein